MLVLVILLLGLVAIPTVHAQLTLARSLRATRERAVRSSLRLAASDAIWYLLEDSVGTSFPPLDEQGNCIRVTPLPSGGEVSVVVVQATNVSGTIVGALLSEGQQNDKLYLVDSTASASGTSERVSCVVRKDTDGTAEIAGWLRGHERSVRRRQE